MSNNKPRKKRTHKTCPQCKADLAAHRHPLHQTHSGALQGFSSRKMFETLTINCPENPA